MSLQGNMARTAIEGLETKTAEMEALAARLEAEVARLRAQAPDEERLMTRAQWWELMCAVDADEEPVTFLALNAVGEPQAYSCPPRLSLGLTPAEGASELLAALTRSAREVVLAQIAWAKRQEERERRAAEDDAQASIGGGDNAHG